MKKLILAALALLVVTAPAMAGKAFPRQTDVLMDSPNGYIAVVCSTWANDSDPDGGYTTFDAPTGYWFHRIQILGYNVGAADQAVTIRFWDSATDSVQVGAAGAIAINLGPIDGVGIAGDFPVRCYKASFTGVDNTDDLQVIGYARDH